MMRALRRHVGVPTPSLQSTRIESPRLLAMARRVRHVVDFLGVESCDRIWLRHFAGSIFSSQPVAARHLGAQRGSLFAPGTPFRSPDAPHRIDTSFRII